MRAILVPAAFVLGLVTVASGSTPAAAAGCVKGAIIGGVAGHYVGHHGLLGAAAGCLIGRHQANKHSWEHAQRERAYEQGHEAGQAGHHGGAPL
jgi:uncharacterized protein YcfJ